MSDLKVKKATDLIERAKASKVIARRFIQQGDVVRGARWIGYAKADLAEATAVLAEVRG